MSKTLLRSTAVVSSMTFISRILGFARDVVIAQTFGASSATDAFFVAFRIPNLFRRMFAEGAFASAFVPVFAEYRQSGNAAELRELVDRVSGTLAFVLCAITTVGVIAAPLLIYAFAPGFTQTDAQYELTVAMLRLTFPYLLFISLTACAGSILNSFGRFAVPAVTPVFLNLALIMATLWIAPNLQQPIMALAWGVFIAGIVQLLFQLPALYRLNMLPKPRWGWAYAGVQKILRLMIPVLFGSSVAQINVLLNTVLASFLVSGSVSWLYYSDRLVEFPLGLFGVALGTVILPKLSQQHHQASPEAFSKTLDWALRWALLLGIPATVALAVLAGPLLATLFQYQAFTALDVDMASRSLAVYALGLTTFMVIKVLAPGFYARQDTRTPVKIGILAMVANMILSLSLILPLAHVGLALATALSACINASLLLHTLRKQRIYRPNPGWQRFLVQIAVSSSLMGVVLWWWAGELQLWLSASASERAEWLLQLVILGLALYGLALLAVGIRPSRLKL